MKRPPHTASLLLHTLPKPFLRSSISVLLLRCSLPSFFFLHYSKRDMHAKTDSEATSIDAALSWPPRSPPRSAIRPLYYVQSPSNHDVEKMSFGSGCSPMGSPSHPNYYHCSPIHHSRESSTSRFSDRALLSYKSIREGSGRRRYINSAIDEETDGGDDDSLRNVRLYSCLLLSLLLLFTIFSLILWGASKSYPPKVVVKVNYNISLILHSVTRAELREE